MAKRFKLWLDESGDFNDEKKKKHLNPSLVGGVLCEYDQFGTSEVNSIIKEEYFHANENISAERSIEILKKVIDKGAIPVIFENTKKLNIVDCDITYMNIFAEGLAKLIEKLISEHGKVEIDILKARRIYVEHNSRTNTIKEDEYKSRIEERIKIWLIKKGISLNSVKWNFSIESARTDKRLMISDCICNAYLTRGARKFESYREEIEGFISKFKVIEVLNKIDEDEVREYILLGNIYDAILEFVSEDNIYNNKDIEEAIIDKINNTNYELVKMQFDILGNKLEALVNYHRKLESTEKILLRLENEFIGKLGSLGIRIDELRYQVLISLLSLYIHRGEGIVAREYARKVEKCIGNISSNEDFNKLFRVKNKLAVLMNDEFDFENAISELDKNIRNIELRAMTMKMMKEEILGESDGEIKDIELGKSLGTRIQSRVFLSRFNKKELELAKIDSDNALNLFENTEDFYRQLQYRVIVETESGNYEEAVKLLKKSIVKDINFEGTLEEVMDKVTNTDEINIFNLMHYCRVMGEAALKEQIIADEMYKALNKRMSMLSVLTEEIDENSNTQHPMEIIHWKLGTYYAARGMYKAAINSYDKAIKILSYNKKSIVRQVIGLAILCEKAHFIALDRKGSGKELNATLGKIDKNINELLECSSEKISEFIKINFANCKEDLFKASRKVAY